MEHCCDQMAYHLNFTCEQHPDKYDCGDAVIDEVRGGVGLIISREAGGGVIEIAYCPWCGIKLPPIRPLDFDD